MEKHILVLMIVLSWMNIGFADDAGKSVYENPNTGISFHYPPSLAIDKEKSTKEPLSVVFRHGEPPFAVHILFKEIRGFSSLEAFIQAERANQKEGGYTKEIIESRRNIGNNISAIRFVRKSTIGEIHYFVFPSHKSKHLYAFWHTTNRITDPNMQALDAFEEMIKSLKIE